MHKLVSEDPNDPKLLDKRREHKRFSENHYNRAQTLAAWLLATLVAVNTSGAAAILTAAKGADRQPAIMFAIGVALAVASGMCSWAEAFRHSDFHFGESHAPDDLNEADKRRWDRSKTLAPMYADLAVALNILALSGFVIGCIWASQAL